jgi:hypothetical protein
MKYTENNLPKVFKFTHADENIVFTARPYEGTVEWVKNGMPGVAQYPIDWVVKTVNAGLWTIVDSKFQKHKEALLASE